MSKLQVYTLLGQKGFEFSLRCLKSFVKHCKDEFDLIAYNDGSLGNIEKEILMNEVNASNIIEPEWAQKMLNSKLNDYPNVGWYHKNVVFAKKLIDIPLIAEKDFCFIDSDVFFLQDFHGISKYSDKEVDLIVMQDVRDVYCLSYFERLKNYSKIRLPDKVNSGMYFLKKGAFKLDIIEWFLKKWGSKISKHSWRFNVIEQTTWAVLATFLNTHYWDPKQVLIPTDSKKRITESALALHFTSIRRHLFNDILISIDQEAYPKTTEVKTIPIYYKSIFDSCYERIKHKLT